MSKNILVDTSVIIDFLRRNDKYDCLFLKLSKIANIYIDLTVVSELWAGKSMDSKEKQRGVETILNECTILIPDIETAKIAGKIARNNGIGFQDAWIASAAIRNNLVLATLNDKHFRQIKELSLFEG